MSNDVIAATLAKEINDTAKEKDIDPNTVAEFLAFSIKKAYAKKNYEDNLEVFIDPKTGALNAYLLFEVVDDEFAKSNDFDDILQIAESDPAVKAEGLKVGDFYKKPFNIVKEFSHSQVQQILQSFKQKIVEVTNQKVFNAWKDKVGEIVLAELEREDQKKGSLYVNLDFPNLIKTMGFVSLKEQNKLEHLEVGRKYPFVIKEVTEVTKFWPVVLSRADGRLINYYMALENPEIEDGTIEIKDVARIAGLKTKVVVASKQPTITEPAAICVGQKGMRIKAVSNAIGGEKIEVYNYSDDPIVMIANLFGKNKIKGIKLIENEEGKIVKAIVVADKELLPMLIGSYGHNIKLNNKLLGFNIEVLAEEDLGDEDHDYLKVNTVAFEDHFVPRPIIKPMSRLEIDEEYRDENDDDDDYLEDDNHLLDESHDHLEHMDDMDLYDEAFGEELENILKNDKK